VPDGGDRALRGRRSRGCLTPAAEPVRVVEDERAQALVLIVAGGAPLEVGAQLGKLRVDVVSGELELDEAVELVEDSSQPTSGPGRAECLIEFRFAPLCRLLSGRVARDAGLLQVSA
jgi:hypothetical protein